LEGDGAAGSRAKARTLAGRRAPAANGEGNVAIRCREVRVVKVGEHAGDDGIEELLLELRAPVQT
jgi:hypothetical protein